MRVNPIEIIHTIISNRNLFKTNQNKQIPLINNSLTRAIMQIYANHRSATCYVSHSNFIIIIIINISQNSIFVGPILFRNKKKRKMNADKITKWQKNRYVNAGKQNEAKGKSKRKKSAAGVAGRLFTAFQ